MLRWSKVRSTAVEGGGNGQSAVGRFPQYMKMLNFLPGQQVRGILSLIDLEIERE